MEGVVEHQWGIRVLEAVQVPICVRAKHDWRFLGEG